MDEGDAVLLERWREGDRDAGELLVARHFDGLCRFFRNKVGDDAPDLIQQTFLACCEGRERIRGESRFRTYLFGVAKNVLFTHFRRRRKAAERFDPLEESVAQLGPTFGSALGRRREEQVLLQALRSLPLDLQIVFELYHLEGLTAGELAQMHGITESGMYGRLRKARLLVIAEVERIAETPDLRKSTVHGLDDWAAGLRDLVGSGTEET
jgi:RNA polymerase sigma factor (sigma-70 family)